MTGGCRTPADGGKSGAPLERQTEKGSAGEGSAGTQKGNGTFRTRLGQVHKKPGGSVPSTYANEMTDGVVSHAGQKGPSFNTNKVKQPEPEEKLM